ncbi:unnamed protein product [Cuscuta campestris]|uniref:Uncharacterized protein n=1 Tax=Cuscuta campestris TaxID=132261 RepID=A0A484LTZ6_9ASTE|nr:unnamed protein product [Cuscuta campestris]
MIYPTSLHSRISVSSNCSNSRLDQGGLAGKKFFVSRCPPRDLRTGEGQPWSHCRQSWSPVKQPQTRVRRKQLDTAAVVLCRRCHWDRRKQPDQLILVLFNLPIN